MINYKLHLKASNW